MEQGSKEQRVRSKGQRQKARFANKRSSKRYYFFSLAFVIGLIGCAESVDHDGMLAGKRAVEFAQVAFVKHDIEKGYALFADSAKRYVSLETFKATVSRLHPRAFPTSVIATEWEPMSGEKAIYIYLIGENSGEHFHYRLTMEGTAAADYRVTRLSRGDGPYAPSGQKQKIGKSPST